MNMTQMSLAMRRGETIAWKDQAKLVVALSIPAVLEQLVMTMMSYIDTAMVGSLGYLATASIGVVASTILAGQRNRQRRGSGLFRADRAISQRGTRKRQPQRLVSGDRLQSFVRDRAGGFGDGFRTVSPRPARRGRISSAPCARVFLHRGDVPVVQHGIGHVFGHFPMQRKRTDPEPYERRHVRAGRDLQRSFDLSDAQNRRRHGLGRGPLWAPRFY